MRPAFVPVLVSITREKGAAFVAAFPPLFVSLFLLLCLLSLLSHSSGVARDEDDLLGASLDPCRQLNIFCNYIRLETKSGRILPLT